MTFHPVPLAKNLAVVFNYLLFLIPMLNLSENFIGCAHRIDPKLDHILPPPPLKPALALTVAMAS